MGFITNQWVNRGNQTRARAYEPVPVDVTCQVCTPDDEWSEKRGVVCELAAKKKNGEFQTLLLEPAEVNAATEFLFNNMTMAARQDLLAKALAAMSDDELVGLVGAYLKLRPRPRKSQEKR